MTDVAALVRAAESRIRPHIVRTPVLESRFLGQALGSRVVLKCENLQRTGSFKVRGALNTVLALDDSTRAKGVATASTGNHGAAVAHAARVVGTRAVVFVPEHAIQSKVAAIRDLGAEIVVHGEDCVQSEAEARRWADANSVTYVSPYNDPAVVGGQGTVGLELAEQVDDLARVYVALGGGGLCSGIAGYLREASPSVQVIGCSPAASCVMIDSVGFGELRDLPSEPTLSDGTAGGVELDSITFPIVRDTVAEFVKVDEDAIRAAFADVIEHEKMLVEGAAAMAYGACRQHATEPVEGTTAIVLCGANVGVERLRAILDDDAPA